MDRVEIFAAALKDALLELPYLIEVRFRGSFANGSFDQHSDIDLIGQVNRPLDGRLYNDLFDFLRTRFGPFSVRYDPDDKDDTRRQDVRISFENYSIFQRVDLVLWSPVSASAKWPAPFPEWSLVHSAFWNVVWAAKYQKRGMKDTESVCISAACVKLGLDTRPDISGLLDHLDGLKESDKGQIRRLREELTSGPESERAPRPQP